MSSRPLSSAHSGYGVKLSTPVVSPAANKTLELYLAALFNGTGGSITAAAAKKLAPVSTMQQFFSITDASTPDAADITSAILAGTAAQQLISTTNNDGFLVQCAQKFSVIGINVTQAQAGSPVYEYTYWNGSAYAALSTIEVPASYAAGIQIIAFHPPVDWVAGSSAAVGGNTSGYYSIRVRATTAPSTAVQVGNGGTAPSIWLASFMKSMELATKTGFELQAFQDEPLCLDAQESLIPYFSGSANAANTFSVLYKNSG